MKMIWWLILVQCFVNCFSIKSYKDYRIYEILLSSDKQWTELLNLSESHQEYDFLILSGVVNTTSRVIVPPYNVTTFEKFLNENLFDYKVINYDLLKTIKLQQSPSPRGCAGEGCKNLFSAVTGISFNKYYRHKKINGYLDSLAKRYPTRVKVRKIGTSYWNKELKVIRITDGSPISSSRKVIFIEAGIHGREWLSPATALYIIHQLVEKFSTNKGLLKNYEWIILPVANPDGYEYSHITDRNWRKTTKPNKNVHCPGTDPNRNFDYKWKNSVKLDECDECYRGSKPFSEPETQALRRFVTKLGSYCTFYLSLHSFGRFLLLPWNAELGIPLKTYPLMEEIAMAGYKVMASFNKNAVYKIGNVMRVFNNRPITGSSMDYMHAKLNIPVTITMELPGGKSGFDPTRSELEEFLEESWLGIRAMASAVQLKFL